MSDTIKKQVGRSLCVIFGALVLSAIIACIPMHHHLGTSLQAIAEAVFITAALYIAFNRRINAGIGVKAGALIYACFSLLFFVDTASLIINGDYLLNFGLTAFCIYNLAQIIPLILFYWGLKIWMPIKAVFTLCIIPKIIFVTAYCKFISALDLSDYTEYENAMEQYSSTIETVSYMYLTIYAISLILTIVWLSTGSKSAGHKNEQAVPKARQAVKPNLINKIPHK